jgi:death-on-curing protein
MIDYQEVLEIHQVLIQAYGGTQGVRDENGLKSALERPFSGFGETIFYPKPEEKAGAILESIVKNHPFIDGNKRTGYVLMRLVLMNFGKDIQATQDEKYDFVISVASGQLEFQQIVTWIMQHTKAK